MTAPRPSSRSAAFRRYPALAWLVGAGLLALLLPSGLTLPQSGPPTLAEYAPVPGQGEGSADVSELGQPSSGGLGSGGGDGGGAGRGSAATTTTAPPQPDQRSGGSGVRKPGTKRCVGKPARQTEDPLSPACVAFWDGDNGGATAQGVTADRVTVVLEVDFNERSDTGGGKRLIDCAGPTQESDNDQDRFCRAFMRYFNERYQTYKRTVHLWANHGFTPAELDERLAVFAVAGRGGSTAHVERGMMSVRYGADQRIRYVTHAPYVIGFRPDLEDQARMFATWVCSKLEGQPARYAGDPLLRQRTRVFGLWAASGASPYRDRVLEQLEESCGITIPPERRATNFNDSTGPARLHSEGVTTVLYMDSNNTGQSVTTKLATQSGYFPEWLVPGSAGERGLDTNFYARLADPAQWANAFGVTFDYRRDAVPDQYWYRAFREGCPDCAEPVGTGASLGATLYDVLNLLFTGIQAAGPRLTPENVDRGLHALPPVASLNPYQPAAYFEPGNHTFVKDAMPIWWDPSGQPPGSGATGCYRLPGEGRRYRAGEWPAGHDDVKAPGPCQGDPSQS